MIPFMFGIGVLVLLLAAMGGKGGGATPGGTATDLPAGGSYLVTVAWSELARAGATDQHSAEAVLDTMVLDGISSMTGGSPTTATFQGTDPSGQNWTWLLQTTQDVHVGGFSQAGPAYTVKPAS